MTIQSLERGEIALDPFAGTMAARDLHEEFPPVCDRVQVGMSVNVSMLALDLGSHTGYALRKRDGKLIHGTKSFTPRKLWGPGQKWQQYRRWLSDMIVENNVTTIAYEDVKNHAGVLAAHAYGGFLAHLECVADQHRIELKPLGVTQVKRFWTGEGNADKAAMMAQCKARGFRVEDDNDSDAVAILHLAVSREAAGWAPMDLAPRKKYKPKPRAKASKEQGELV